MGKFPVTNALFQVFIEKTGYKTTAEKFGYGVVFIGRHRKMHDIKTGKPKSIWSSKIDQKIIEVACWYQPNGPGSSIHDKRSHPVVQISLNDAMAYASWTGKRVPSENEWEASSRTDKALLYPWGNEMDVNLCNLEKSGLSDTTSVDKYLESENAFGLNDTLGNVLEWTSDVNINPYIKSKKVITNIVKGGSWISENSVRFTSRFYVKKDYTSNALGFRCVSNHIFLAKGDHE